MYTRAPCGCVMVSVYIHFLMLKGSVLRYGINENLQFKELQLPELPYKIYIKLVLERERGKINIFSK